MKNMKSYKSNSCLGLSKQKKLYLKTSSDWVPIYFCKASFLVLLVGEKKDSCIGHLISSKFKKRFNFSLFTGSHTSSAVTYLELMSQLPTKLLSSLALVLYHCKVTCIQQSKITSMLRITSSMKQIFPCKAWGKQIERKMMIEENTF